MTYKQFIIFIFIIVVAGHFTSLYGQTKVHRLGEPLFSYAVHSPNMDFRISEGELFNIYSDGRILFSKNNSLWLSQMDTSKIADIIDELRAREILSITPKFINAVSDNPNDSIVCCDLPSYTLIYKSDTINVLGSLRNPVQRKRFPKIFSNVRDYVLSYQDNSAIKFN